MKIVNTLVAINLLIATSFSPPVFSAEEVADDTPTPPAETAAPAIAPKLQTTFQELTDAQKTQTAVTRVSSLELLAQSEFQNGETKACLKTLKQAFKVFDESSKKDFQQHARLMMIRGDCYYVKEKYAEAIQEYGSAYSELNKLKGHQEVSGVTLDECANALAGSYVHERQYEKAAPVYEDLVKRTETSYGPSSVQLVWAYLDLMNIYRELNRLDEVKKMRARFGELLSANVSKQELDSTMRAKPAGVVEQRPLPLILWRAKAAPPKAIIVAVHGLGLHCASFQKFAERMNAEGISVCAMDVRGFGSWKLARGREQIDLKNSLGDLRGLVNIATMRYPDVPVFVLGESMGGAIALRYAAEYPDTVNGVISSVPADRRYQEKREAFRVALHFLKHPNKPISVENVLSRAATKDSVSADVFTDPMMRADLSPKELVKFQLFMSETAIKASQIKACPVLMVQGMKDRLVKPGATIDLYNNLKTADRDLYLVGECQHLIFEEVDTPDVVFQSLMVWLNNRIKAGRPGVAETKPIPVKEAMKK